MDSDEIKINYNKKYDFMGITPKELYLRQSGKCNLKLIIDRIENEDYFGDLVCTDGKENAPSSCILNPTFECSKCMSSFIEKLVNNMLDIKKINSITFAIVSEINAALLKHGENLEIEMCSTALDKIDKHLIDTTMYINKRYKPLRITPSGDIVLFGAKINLNETIEENSIFIKSDNKTIKIF